MTKFLAERVHEAGPARAEEETRAGDQAAPEEPQAEGDAHQEAVQGHLQDPDPAIQGSQGSGSSLKESLKVHDPGKSRAGSVRVGIMLRMIIFDPHGIFEIEDTVPDFQGE